MPLAPEGKKILSAFIQEYGSKKGKSVFYAKENMGGKFKQLVRHGKKKRKS